MSVSIVAGIDDPYLRDNLPTYIARRGEAWVFEGENGRDILRNLGSEIDLVVIGEDIGPHGAENLLEELWVMGYDFPVVIYGDHFDLEGADYDGPVFVLRSDCRPDEFERILDQLGFPPQDL